MPELLSITDCAAEIGFPPITISKALFEGHIDVARCPRIGNRRAIPRDYLPEVARILTERAERKRLAAAGS